MPDPYPIPALGGPRYTVFDEPERDFDKAVQVNEFKDGGASYYKVGSSQGLRFFLFRYNNLTEAEQIILDTHYNSCVGKWLGFEFTNPRTGEIFQNVHYHRFEGNEKAIAWRKSRTVILIKRPG